eukprot:s923_g27.t4
MRTLHCVLLVALSICPHTLAQTCKPLCSFDSQYTQSCQISRWYTTALLERLQGDGVWGQIAATSFLCESLNGSDCENATSCQVSGSGCAADRAWMARKLASPLWQGGASLGAKCGLLGQVMAGEAECMEMDEAACDSYNGTAGCLWDPVRSSCGLPPTVDSMTSSMATCGNLTDCDAQTPAFCVEDLPTLRGAAVQRASNVALPLLVAAPHIAINLSEYKSKALAKLVFATTKTSEPVKGDLVEILAQEFLRRADSMSMSLLTAMLLAFWKADLSNPDFFRQAASKVQACLKDFETSGFIRLLKIFAAAGAMEPAFIQDMVDEAQRRLPSLRATEFVNLAKTLLQIGQASPFLLESLVEHGDKVLPQMSQKELTSFLRSLSGLGLTSASSSGEALFRQAASKATRQLLRSKDDRRYSLKSSDLACLSRVFARAAAATGPLTDKYQASAETPCAELREAIERFLQAAVEEARQRLDEFQASPACLVGVLWAASECKVECESLMKATIAVLLPSDAPGGDNSLQRLQLPELAELAKALTHLGVEQVELYKALADVAVACMQEPNNARHSAFMAGVLHSSFATRQHEPQSLVSLSGTLEVRVLRGCAEIWGASLLPSKRFRRLVVPPWCSTPRIRAVRGKSLGFRQVDASEAQDVLDFLAAHRWPVVLCLKLCKESSAELAAPRLRAVLTSPSDHPRLTAHRAWPSILQHFLVECVHCYSEKPPVLLVMGPKGVGKSTCCRYFVNSLLSECPEVYFLETDLGQPELGPPGVVTLHRITQPLLQVPHAEQHHHQRLAAFFAGAVTPSTHPELFVASVAAAVDAYIEAQQGVVRPAPLMVNSHGWTTGLGLELVQQVVAISRAQLVLRLKPSEPCRKRPAESGPEAEAAVACKDVPKDQPKPRRTSLARCGPLARAFGRFQKSGASTDEGLVLVDVESAAKGAGASPTAAQLRWLRIAGHFQPDLDPCLAPHAVAPQTFFSMVPRWRLQMKGLRFGLIAGHLLHSEVEAALTGTVVALCSQPQSESQEVEVHSSEDLGLLEPHEAPIEFVAYAFVHSFDFRVGQIVVHSSLSESAVGSVGPPEEHLVPAAELLSLLATVGISASVLASTAADKVLSVLDQADTGEIKLPAWVIARCIAGLALSVPVGRILGALKLLARAATARAVELLPEERALIFWSLSLQGCYEEFFEAVLEQTPWTLWAPKLQDELVISGNGYVPSPKLVALCQVHLADLALRIEGGGDRAGLSAAQRTHVVEAAQVMARIRPEIPAEAEPISQALISMELLPSLGSSTPEGLPLSIRVSSSSIRGSGASTLSIEVDRPGDLLFDIDSGKAHRFLPTALRRRLLWCLGYTVVVLPWYEVNCCDNEQLVALLRARLAEVSPPRPRFTSDRGGQSKLHEADERNRVSSAEASGNSSSSVSSWQAMRQGLVFFRRHRDLT